MSKGLTLSGGFLVALVVLSLVITLAQRPAPVYAAGDSIPFRPGEKIHFIVKWAFIPAAEATLQVLPMTRVNRTPSYHFAMIAKTYPYVDLLYRVRRRVDAFVDTGFNHSLLYRVKEEGQKKRDITVNFDWKRRLAQYRNFDETRSPIPVLPGAFDPLSVFYAFRLFDLSEDLQISAIVSDGKKCVTGMARVGNKETIKVRGKPFETFLVEPDLKDIGGVFRKSKDATLQIWVTADKRHIPVRIKSKVVVGSFVAEMVSFDPGGR